MKATLDAGLSIPEDVAIVGYDKVRYARYLQILLTSIDESTAEMGKSAATLALDLASQKVDKPKTILLTPTLVVRKSTVAALKVQLPELSGPSLVRKSKWKTKKH